MQISFNKFVAILLLTQAIGLADQRIKFIPQPGAESYGYTILLRGGWRPVKPSKSSGVTYESEYVDKSGDRCYISGFIQTAADKEQFQEAVQGAHELIQAFQKHSTMPHLERFHALNFDGVMLRLAPRYLELGTVGEEIILRNRHELLSMTAYFIRPPSKVQQDCLKKMLESVQNITDKPAGVHHGN